jgi:hypothetical protein
MPFTKFDQVNSQIRDSIKPIDDILSFIISPTGNEFSEKDLVELYNYPVVDLLDIDTDYM